MDLNAAWLDCNHQVRGSMWPSPYPAGWGPISALVPPEVSRGITKYMGHGGITNCLPALLSFQQRVD